MKKYLYYALCGLASSVLFASCDNDDDEKSVESYSQKIKYDRDGSISSKETYKYDEQGRVTSYEYIHNNELSSKETEFNYDGNTATYKREDYGKSYTGKKVFRTEDCNYDDFLTNQLFENETEILNETRTFNEKGLITKYSRTENGIKAEECEYSYEGNKITYRKKTFWEDETEITDYTAEYADENYKQIKKISIVLDPETTDPRTKEYQYSYDSKGRINGIKYFYDGKLYKEQKDYKYSGSKVTYKDCMCNDGEVYYEFTCEEINWDKANRFAEVTTLSQSNITTIKIPYIKEDPNKDAFFTDNKYSVEEYNDAGLSTKYYWVGKDDFFLTVSTNNNSFRYYADWVMNEKGANEFVEAYKNVNGDKSHYEIWVTLKTKIYQYDYCRGIDLTWYNF